jgi:hypothetical protein
MMVRNPELLCGYRRYEKNCPGFKNRSGGVYKPSVAKSVAKIVIFTDLT